MSYKAPSNPNHSMILWSPAIVPPFTVVSEEGGRWTWAAGQDCWHPSAASLLVTVGRTAEDNKLIGDVASAKHVKRTIYADSYMMALVERSNLTFLEL